MKTVTPKTWVRTLKNSPAVLSTESDIYLLTTYAAIVAHQVGLVDNLIESSHYAVFVSNDFPSEPMGS